MDKRICKSCKVIKDRIPDGVYKNGKNKKFRDNDNLLWSGSTCGVCNQIRLKEHMKSKRNTLEKIIETEPDFNATKKDPLDGCN